MSFISALGGIGQGVSQGIQDLNLQKQQKALEEQQAFQKAQNVRLLAQQAEEDRVANEIKGIKRTSTPDQWGAGYEAEQARNTPVRDDNGNLMPGVKAGIARPQHEIMSEMAAKYLASPDLKQQQYGLQLQQASTALGKQAKEQAVFEKYRPQFEQLATPTGALNYLNEKGIPAYNAKVPDGYKVAQGETLPNGSTAFHVLDKKGKLVESHAVPTTDLQNLAAKHLTGLAQHELGYLSPENFRDFMKHGLEERKTTATETTARAAETNAQTQHEYHKQGGVYQQIAQMANAAHIEAAKIARSAHGMMTPLQEAQLKELTSFANLADKFQQQLDDPKTPKKELEKTANQLAVHPSGKALNTVLVRDAETGETKPVTVNKFEHLTDIHQKGKAPEAAISAIQSGKLIDPKTKKQRPITLSDVEEFNRMFPNSPVDPSTLPYLKTK
jgi:hypothetical protein